MKTSKCYMCNAEGITKEHAPPDCFFPEGYRENLIKVPSCPDHNTKNSMDVEYVRNIIVNPIQTNEVAREHFNNKVLRSYKRSPKLFNQTFKDAKPILFDGQKTQLNPIDLKRFKSVMSSMAFALYFHMFGRKYFGSWEIVSPHLVSYDALSKGVSDGWDEVRNLLFQTNFVDLEMSQPKVFQCGIKEEPNQKLVYQFVFYGGFKVYAISIPFYHKAISRLINPITDKR